MMTPISGDAGQLGAMIPAHVYRLSQFSYTGKAGTGGRVYWVVPPNIPAQPRMSDNPLNTQGKFRYEPAL